MSHQAPSAAAEPARVFIVDDHPLIREGLAELIRRDPALAVCGEAGSATECLRKVAAARPGLIVVDINLPDRGGLDLIKDLQNLLPDVPVLVYSMCDESLYAERVLRAGARGFVMKRESGRRTLEAMHDVLEGRLHMSTEVADGLVAKSLNEGKSRASPRRAPGLSLLTDRELEIFRHIGLGRGTREIARLLHRSPKTVEVHRTNIKRKLGVPETGGLIRMAVQWSEAQDRQ